MRIFTLLLLTLTTAAVSGQICPADFTYAAVSCNELEFRPSSTSRGTVRWNFGDGQTSTEVNPTHIFDVEDGDSKVFPVTLITGGSCVPDTVTQWVTINPNDLPDVSIESVGIYNFVNCAPTNDRNYELAINNTSATRAENTFYTIDWGDGTPNYSAADLPDGTSHVYSEVGLYHLTVSVRGANGCWAQETVPFFYGSNPGGNIVPVSNQIACVPEDVRFTISGTEQNPPGTTYKVWVNDGLGDTTYFNHPPPSEYVYHLTKSPCESAETSNNYFNIYFEATNPCFTQSGGTIIRANKVPEVDFTADETTCEGGVVSIRNESEPALYAVGNGCSFDMMTRWVVSAEPWQYEIVSGSLSDENGVDIRFLEAGEYTVTLNYTPRYSNACTAPPMSRDICVVSPPVSDFTVRNDDPESCTPVTVSTTNTSHTPVECAGGMTYAWLVDYLPADCGEATSSYTLLGGNSAYTDRDIQIRFDSAGVYRLGLVATNACGSDTSYQEVRVAESPRLAIQEIPDTCMLGPVSLQPVLDMNIDCSDPPTYSWDFDGGTGGDPGSADPGLITYDQPGTYTISVTVSNGCGLATTSETFEIFGEATMPTISVTPETCASSTIVAQLNTPGLGMTFHWTGPDGFEAHTAAWTRPHATTAMSGNYTVTATNSLGCSVSATYAVEVEPQAPIEVTADGADLCIGETVTLRATGGSAYTWTGDHLSGTTGPEVTFTHDQPGTYTVIVHGTDPAGRCDASDTVYVEVFSLPNVDAGPAQEACVDQEIQLEGTPFTKGKRGTWSGDFVSTDGTFLADTPGTYTLTYTYATKGGCSASDQTTVCVRDQPVANFTVDPTDACEATGLILRPRNLTNDLDACSPAKVRWSVTPDSTDCGVPGYAFIEGTSASSREPVIELIRTDAYTVTLDVISACGDTSSSTYSERVMVLGKPDVAITAVDTLCGAQSVDFTATRAACSSPVTTYVWSFETASPPSTYTGLTPPSIYYEPGTHTVSLTAFTACGSTTVTEELVISRPPAIALTLPQETVCKDEQLTVAGTITGEDLRYRWTASDPRISFSDTTAALPDVRFTGVPAGTYTLNILAYGNACAPAEQTLSITVKEAPAVRLDPLTDGCDQIAFLPTYYLGTAPVTSVRWELSDGVTSTVLSTTADPGVVFVDRPGTYALTLTATNDCGSTSDSRTFTVYDSGAFDLSVAATVYCHDGLTEVPIVNRLPAAADHYRWTVVDASGTIYATSEEAAPVFTLDSDVAPGDYTIQAMLRTANCGDVSWDTLITLAPAPTAAILPIEVSCDVDGFDPEAAYTNYASIDSVRWSFPAGSFPASSTERNPGWITLADYGSDLTVRLHVYGICGEQTTTARFDRPAPPTVSLALSDTLICAGDNVRVINTSSTGLTYDWQVTPTTGVSISDADATSPDILFAGPAGTYTVSAVVTDSLCTTETLTYRVIVDGAPTVTIDQLPDGCGITSVTPRVTYGGDTLRYDSIRWTLAVLSGADAGAVLYTGGHRSAPIDLVGPATYVFTAAAYSRCSPVGSVARDTFIVNDPPLPDLLVNDDAICPGAAFTARDGGGQRSRQRELPTVPSRRQPAGQPRGYAGDLPLRG